MKKKSTPILLRLYLCIVLLASTHILPAQAYTESFNDIYFLTGNGWYMQNNSSPLGVTGWSQGLPPSSTGPFNSYSGADNAYISANFRNAGSAGTISNWLVTPTRTLRNGDVLTFYTRAPGVSPIYPDRLEVRMSTNGASTNVGTSATAVGDFTTLLLSINPTLNTSDYPFTWTQYTITISGLSAPTSGRLAFRYYVTASGPSGTNGDYIGIDDVTYIPYICPGLTVLPASLPNAAVETAYSQSLSQTGGLGTPTYTIASGLLPPGLTLSTGGTISGMPTTRGTFSFTVAATDASGCVGTKTYVLTVDCPPNPVYSPLTQTVCSGAAISPISLTNSFPAAAVFWSRDNIARATGMPASGTGNISGMLTNTTNAPVTVAFTIISSVTGCNSTLTTATVVVNPLTDVNTISSQVVCNSALTTAVNFSGSNSSAIYSWTNNNPSIGLAANGNGNISSFTATNTSSAPQVATITVTPKSQATAVFNYTGNMQTWTVPAGVTSITVDARGSKGGDCIYNQPGIKPDDLGGLGGRVIAEYPVTPGQVLNVFVGGIPYNGGGTGNGALVQPHGGGASDIRIGGTSLTDRVIIAGGGGGAGNNCSNTAERGGKGGGLTGETGWQCGTQTGTEPGLGGTQSAGGAGGTSPATSGTLGIGGNGGGSGSASGGGGGGYYGGGGAAYGGAGGGSSYTNPLATSVAHTQGFQNGTGQVIISYNLCAGTSKTFDITVNPTPTVNAVTNKVVCNGGSVASIPLTGNITGTVYKWTNNTSSIGLPASGTGDIPVFSAVNTGNTPVVALITVTPEYNNGGTTCTGTPVTFTITVNPTPIVTATPASQTVCSGPITTIALTSSVTGTVFNWTRNNTGTITGIPASGSGDISGTLTNTTTSAVTVTFTITPVANGCPGTPVTATITINAAPVITCPANITTNAATGLCTATVTYTPTATGIPVPTFSYSLSGATTGSGSGTGSGTAFNKGTTTVTITATNSCGSVNCSFTVTVNDTQNPTITCPAPVTVDCAGAIPAPNTASVTATDNCPGVTVAHVSDVISAQTCANRYTITRTYRATDAAGNTATCTQVITVDDQKAPVITCPANITATTLAGSCTAVVNFTVTATDNCSGPVTITSSPASGTVFPIGTTTVTSTAVDACGNTSTCTFTVTVNGGQSPVITTQPVNRSVCIGGSATFSADVTNAVSYQWERWNGTVWVNVNGATASSYTVNGATTAMNTDAFRVRVTGLCATITSNAATLFVNPTPTVSITSSNSPVLLPTQTTSLVATVAPAGGTFVWQRNGDVLAGAATNTLANLSVDNSGTYRVVYIDPNGCVNTSNEIVLSAAESGNFYVAPNPNQGRFWVRYYTGANEQVVLTVYDLKGAVIYRKSSVSAQPYTRIDVDLGIVASGSYIVELRDSNGKRLGTKLVWVNNR